MQSAWFVEQCSFWLRQLKFNEEQIVYWQKIIDQTELHRHKAIYQEVVDGYVRARQAVFHSFDYIRRCQREWINL
jgi:hypothetical protein